MNPKDTSEAIQTRSLILRTSKEIPNPTFGLTSLFPK
jgi:hypothetical protein